MTVRPATLPPILFVLAASCLGMAAQGSPADERAGHLIELCIAYGDTHFNSAANLVTTPTGYPELPEYSLPYALALLEAGLSTSRAKAVFASTLAMQDATPASPTRGLFRWWGVATAEFSADATARIAPLLARAVSAYGDRLGDDLRNAVLAAMDLARGALALELRRAKGDDSGVLIQAALAQLGSALGQPQAAVAAANAVSRWTHEIALGGRTWGPSPAGDATRIMALSHIWQALPVEGRGPVEDMLRLCYLDLLQRAHLPGGVLAGAQFSASAQDYLGSGGPASYLIYRDAGGPLPSNVQPIAAVAALSAYRPPDDVVAVVQRQFAPYSVTTTASRETAPARTDTYLEPKFTLGTMSGWCMGDTVPIFAAFSAPQKRPTAFFRVKAAPAHISSLQFGNLAICSLNFDRMGVEKRLQAWLQGSLGTVHDVEEVYAMGSEWNGEPIAVGTRGTVIVKRAGVYLAVTLLECGPAEIESTSRRKPGVLEWTGIGENAELTLTVYARQDEYRVKRPIDDLRAGVVFQVWDSSLFADTGEADRWLARSKINHRQSRGTSKTPVPRDVHPVLDEHKPQPRQQYVTRTQNLHTIEYAYLRGEGDQFKLVEDLRHEQVIQRSRNGASIDTAQWWSSPALELGPGRSLRDVFAPPPQPPPPAAPQVPTVSPAPTDNPG